MVRHADPARDGPACAAIYAPHVRGGTTFEEDAPDPAAFAARIAEGERTHPWLVLERGGAVAGFAYASPHRARAAYRWAAEVSVYVAPDVQGTGAGRALYAALLALLRRQGLRVALAGITLPNPASVGLHEALGFRPVGVFRAIGWKAGAWRDVGWWELPLGSRDDADPPPPPGPPPRLGEDRP